MPDDFDRDVNGRKSAADRGSGEPQPRTSWPRLAIEPEGQANSEPQNPYDLFLSEHPDGSVPPPVDGNASMFVFVPHDPASGLPHAEPRLEAPIARGKRTRTHATRLRRMLAHVPFPESAIDRLPSVRAEALVILTAGIALAFVVGLSNDAGEPVPPVTSAPSHAAAVPRADGAARAAVPSHSLPAAPSRPVSRGAGVPAVRAAAVPRVAKANSPSDGTPPRDAPRNPSGGRVPPPSGTVKWPDLASSGIVVVPSPVPAASAETAPVPSPLVAEETEFAAARAPALDVPEPATLSATPELAAAPVLPAPARPRSFAVQQVVNQYRDAFNALDTRAAQAVWPSVDTKALGRAFERLETQVVELEPCAISVIGERAVAACDGTLTYVPKVGNRGAHVERRQWRFNLSENDDQWEIDSVVTR